VPTLDPILIRRCLALLPLGAAWGCTAPGPVFPPVNPPIVWPAPPDRPRIAYVGALRGETDLGRRPVGWEALRAALIGPTPPVAFVQPTAVAVRGSRLAVSDPAAPGAAAVHVLDIESRSFRSWRPGLRFPIDLVFIGDELAVADAQLGRVLVLDAVGAVRREIGAGLIARPAAIAWDDATRELWVLDAGQHALLAFSLEGELLRSVGRRGNAPGEFNFPAGMCGLPGLGGATRLAVADAMNFRVQIVDAAGHVHALFGRKGDAAGDFSFPRDVAADSDGHLYVLDKHFENVQLFDHAGRLLLAFGGQGAAPGQFNLPAGIVIDEHDRIWIADTHNRRVQVFQYLREEQP
jgi:sugar lactone lactonase YvrE